MKKSFLYKNIAIVGSGGSGLAALWALGHSKHMVSIYEANSQLGGHAHAVRFQNEATGKSCVVDLYDSQCNYLSFVYVCLGI